MLLIDCCSALCCKCCAVCAVLCCAVCAVLSVLYCAVCAVLCCVHPHSYSPIYYKLNTTISYDLAKNLSHPNFAYRESENGPAKFIILDARRQTAATLNMVVGKGTEDVSLYSNTELVFCNLENIHVMRASAQV